MNWQRIHNYLCMPNLFRYFIRLKHSKKGISSRHILNKMQTKMNINILGDKFSNSSSFTFFWVYDVLSLNCDFGVIIYPNCILCFWLNICVGGPSFLARKPYREIFKTQQNAANHIYNLYAICLEVWIKMTFQMEG